MEVASGERGEAQNDGATSGGPKPAAVPVQGVIGNEKYIIFGKMEYIRISNNDAPFSVTMVHRFR